MSTDDPSSFAPPFELRIPLATVVDSSDGVGGVSPVANDAPGPSALIGASPGLSTGAAALPLGPTVPDFSDPSQVALLVARMWGEHMTGASVIPTPAPAQVGSGVGVPGASATPGGSVPSGLTAASQPAGADPTSAASGAIPQPDPSLLAVSLSPGQIELPSAVGLPPSPSLGGGLPTAQAPTIAGDVSPASLGGAPVAPPTSFAGAPVANPAANPFAVAPALDAPTSSGVPQASGGASTGSITQSQVQPGAVPSSDTAPSVPANAGPQATHRPANNTSALGPATPYTHGGAQSGGNPLYGAPPMLDGIARLAFGPPTVASPSPSSSPSASSTTSTPTTGAPHARSASSPHAPSGSSPHAPSGSSPHAPGGASSPPASLGHPSPSGHPSSGQSSSGFGSTGAASPSVTSTPGVPTHTTHSNPANPTYAAPSAPSSPAPIRAPHVPTNLVTAPAPIGPAAELDLPIPTTENPFAAPLQLPVSTPTVHAMPSAPMGQPGLPNAAHVPASSPFGAPVDFGGVLAHPTNPSPPSVTTPPSAPRAEAWPGASGEPNPFSDFSRIEVIDGSALDRLARGDHDPLVNDLSRVAFDPYRVREDFPILNERPHGKRLVWLDNGATTHKPRQVIDRISYFYEHENSNVHRAAHTLAARSSDAYERARESTRRFLNAPSVKEIVWVRGTTEGINLIAKSWGARHVGKGDEIVITNLEHHANIVPWQMLCAATGAKLRVAPVDNRGDVILEEYEKLLGPRTKLVAITHVSNALGTISPVKRMTEMAHRYGAMVMVDGAQGVSHMKIDVQDIGCEWYVFSGHKVYAPTGIGAVWATSDIWDQTPAWQGGGNMIADVTFEKTQYQPPPWKFEAGTGNIADAVGLGAAIEYVERIGMDVIDRYEHQLLEYGTQRLLTVPGLTMIGTSKTKAGVMSFVLDGQRTEDVSAILDKDAIAVRSGHHCAQPILRRFGVEATVRASLALYNVCEDIDALVESLHRLQSGRN